MHAWIVFLLSVMLFTLCDGIKPDDRPTLPKLLNFKLQDKKSDLITRIASDYMLFGTLLLNDEDGTTIETIKQANRHNPVEIINEIFRRWFYSSGTVTWRTLVYHLREAKLNTVANDIESMYNVAEEDEHPPTQSPPSGHRTEAGTKTPGHKHTIKSFKDLVRALADIGNWEALCVNLEIDLGVISELRFSPDPVSSKKMRCLQAYMDTGEAAWEDVIHAVNDPPIHNGRLAKSIAQSYGIDFQRLLKDEL